MTPNEPEISLDEPTIETTAPLDVVGLKKLFAVSELDRIPTLWDAFKPFFAPLAARGVPAYGLSIAFSEEKGCTYMAAARTADFGHRPDDLETYRIPAATYAKFWQKGHLSLMRPTITAIWSQWLPQSSYEATDAPMVEYYDESFDPKTGEGGYGIWVAVKKKA